MVALAAHRNLLPELAHVLGRLPTDESESTILRNLSLVERIGSPRHLHALLDEILRDRRALETIAGRSYRHVNHFDKIVLVDSPHQRGYRLTLHLWMPPYTEQEINDELIHDHRFSFWSHVLTGTLTSESFAPAPKGQRFRQYRYRPNKQDELATVGNFYDFVGEAILDKSPPSHKGAGACYHLSFEQTHRVLLPQAGMTCTLVLRGPRRRDHSNVFNTRYPTQNVRMTNEMFAPPDLAAKLRALGRTLRSGSRPVR